VTGPDAQPSVPVVGAGKRSGGIRITGDISGALLLHIGMDVRAGDALLLTPRQFRALAAQAERIIAQQQQARHFTSDRKRDYLAEAAEHCDDDGG
jgi:hypothetical protein